LIGLVFALPLIAFWWTGRIRQGLAPKLFGLLGLGALQGAIGWYMVSSGLSERVDVSQYRLALHLSVAFAILSLIVWLALDERGYRLGFSRGAVSAGVRKFAAILVTLVFAQVVLGAFVAGLKAGLVYNTWPSMNGQIIPPDYFVEGLGVFSVFESHAAVQFNHRVTAYLLLLAALIQGWLVLSGRAGGRVRKSALVLAAAIVLQAALGIWTLLAHVPLSLGLVHQGGAAIVMALAVWHLHTARRAADNAAGRD
jgi:cytochrome c oxidase assembly protein subunit 15